MEIRTFKKILTQYNEFEKKIRNNYWPKYSGKPVITLAGMGEPLLHPKIIKLIRMARESSYKVLLITNGYLLHNETTKRLLENGIGEIYVSFWGINEIEYEKSMGLSYRKTLNNVENLLRMSIKNDVKVNISWIRTRYIKSENQEIENFWKKRGACVDMSDNLAWNRSGYLEIKKIDYEKLVGVDFSEEIWCEQLSIVHTVTWRGDYIICCNDYFERNNIIGNIFNDSPEKISKKVGHILKKKDKNHICTMCKKPKHDYPFARDHL